ncbi:hypothetical protein O3P69_007094 [Scylla paramamosain]|uniref:Uncharacterized protein n=1 Tax=Scylla paramamosain TaxID=85552 RepID=A0AAW0V2Q8_SCYPA
MSVQSEGSSTLSGVGQAAAITSRWVLVGGVGVGWVACLSTIIIVCRRVGGGGGEWRGDGGRGRGRGGRVVGIEVNGRRRKTGKKTCIFKETLTRPEYLEVQIVLKTSNGAWA